MNEISRLSTATSAADEYLRRANVVYDEQRRRIISIEAEHQRVRTEINNDYGKKLADVAHEGAEALRKLDNEHRQRLADEREKLAAIERLRQ